MANTGNTYKSRPRNHYKIRSALSNRIHQQYFLDKAARAANKKKCTASCTKFCCRPRQPNKPHNAEDDDLAEELKEANVLATQLTVFLTSWQDKFDQLAKLAAVGKVDGAAIASIRDAPVE